MCFINPLFLTNSDLSYISSAYQVETSSIWYCRHSQDKLYFLCPVVSSQDQFCNRISGLIIASQTCSFTSLFIKSLSYPISFSTLTCSLSEGSLRKTVMCLLQLICILSLIFSFIIIYLKERVLINTQKQVPLDIQLANVSFSSMHSVFPQYLFNKLFFCLKFSALVWLVKTTEPIFLPIYIQSRVSSKFSTALGSRMNNYQVSGSLS